MKIRCKCCNKRFDYEMHSGICPKCGEYYRTEEPETDAAKMEEWRGFPQPQEKREEKEPEKIHRDFTEKSGKRKRRSKVYYMVTAILLLVIVLSALVPIIGVKEKQKQQYEEMSVQQLPEAVQCSVGESFTYEGEEDTYDISITGAVVDNNTGLSIPEGYEAVAVSYSIFPQSEKNSVAQEELEEIEEENWQIFDIHMTCYLMTKSGAILMPVREYKLREAKGLDYEQERKLGMEETLCYRQGLIYYLVKKDDVAGLWVGSFDYDEKEYSMTTLRENIQVNGLEVSR